MRWDLDARRAFGVNLGETMTYAEANGHPSPSKLKIGLALGSGAARGWAHIGVLKVLEREGLAPHVIAGTSIGAVAGGCFAAGKLQALEVFARSLTKRRMVGLLDFRLSGSGLIGGDRLRELLEENLFRVSIESLPIRFAAIATEIGTGHEIWLTRGSLAAAMRASYALPGVFDAVKLGGRWLMDGAVVNPVPVSAARALGANLVICINLNGDSRTRGTIIQAHGPDDTEGLPMPADPAPSRLGFFRRPFQGYAKRADDAPGIGTVMVEAMNITQDRIARARLAGDPPDFSINPKVSRLGLFEFHRSSEAIALGEEAAERALPELRELIAEQAEQQQS